MKTSFTQYAVAYATLLLSLLCGVTHCADIYEPNDEFGSATPIALGEVQEHSIDPVGDQDYVVFTLSITQYCMIETWGPAYADTYMRLYDGRTNLIASDDDSGPGAYAMLSLSLAPGAYRVRVTDYGNNDVIPSYFIRVTALEQDAFEPDDPTNRAYVVAVGTKVYHERNWHDLRDVDWYAFTVTNIAAFAVSHTSQYGAVYTLYQNFAGQLYSFATHTSYGTSTWARQLSPGSYVLSVAPRSYPEQYVFGMHLWMVNQFSLSCKKLAFNHYLPENKRSPRHRWQLGLVAKDVPLDSLRGVRYRVVICNNISSNCSSTTLPYGYVYTYAKNDTAVTVETMFDRFDARVKNGRLFLFERMNDTSMASLPSPIRVFAMSDYTYAPKTRLMLQLQVLRNNVVVCYGVCAVNVSAKQASDAVTGKGTEERENKNR